jgi:Major Facilitator Superfamily
VRLSATTRYLGVLVGPGVGSLIMLGLGPNRGILLNTVFYLPLLLWLGWAPYGRHFRSRRGDGAAPPPKRAVRGLDDILLTLREVRHLPVLPLMLIVAAGASFFVGNSYQAQMPGFATDLGHGDPGLSYTMLLGADAAGGLLAGILQESRGGFFAISAGNAASLAMAWALALMGFATVHRYPLALGLLFLAGFFELSFSSMNQTLVQMNAPEASRGRVLGLYNMAGSGLRTFSGITVGLMGSRLGIHTSLAVSAGLYFTLLAGVQLSRWRGRPKLETAAEA